MGLCVEDLEKIMFVSELLCRWLVEFLFMI